MFVVFSASQDFQHSMTGDISRGAYMKNVLRKSNHLNSCFTSVKNLLPTTERTVIGVYEFKSKCEYKMVSGGIFIKNLNAAMFLSR